MKIKDIPCYNCPVLFLKKKDSESLSNAELLAVVIGQVNTKENAIDVSNRVLNFFNFYKLSDRSFS